MEYLPDASASLRKNLRKSVFNLRLTTPLDSPAVRVGRFRGIVDEGKNEVDELSGKMKRGTLSIGVLLVHLIALITFGS